MKKTRKKDIRAVPMLNEANGIVNTSNPRFITNGEIYGKSTSVFTYSSRGHTLKLTRKRMNEQRKKLTQSWAPKEK